MKTKVVAIAVMGLGAWVAPASAQIIATSIPRADSGTGKAAAGEKKFAFHILAAPVSKWKYGELYFGELDTAHDFGIGTVQSSPNGKFLFAGEIAFKVTKSWTIGLGGWYNKVGTTTYGFNGNVFDTADTPPFVKITANQDGDLKMYEGHANIFYKDVGIQAGVINTRGTIGGTNTVVKTYQFPGQAPFDCLSGGATTADCSFPIQKYTSDTKDWDMFGVYKHSWAGATPIGISLGAGAYRKQGTSNTPLRAGVAKTLSTAFATANIDLYKGLGIDTSFWYIGKTQATAGDLTRAGEAGQVPLNGLATTQSRFTIGIGYTFSR